MQCGTMPNFAPNTVPDAAYTHLLRGHALMATCTEEVAMELGRDLTWYANLENGAAAASAHILHGDL